MGRTKVRLADRLKAKAGAELTAREVEVLNLVSLGYSKEEAGKKLHLSKHTIHTHTLCIMAKTRAATMAQALAVAVARNEYTIEVELGDPLPERQQKVLIGYANGRELEQIAVDLNVSLHTVKRDVGELYSTLDAVSRSRPNLVYRGFKTGNLTVNRRKKV
jgi:DNA-binding NarL/FixJ family response regulator